LLVRLVLLAISLPALLYFHRKCARMVQDTLMAPRKYPQ
jgi:hypothetical protein